MADDVLRLDKITKHYLQGEREIRVLEHINLSIRAGESIALIGPSGSGKSTLLHLAGLIDTPDDGEIWLGGRNMTAANDREKTAARLARLGFVYQFHHLLPECTALENAMLPQRLAGATPSAARERASALLETLGLATRIAHYPSQLSGGEQQRVAIARALANKPQVVLADEPTGNLDPATAERVMEALLESVRAEGTALLMATHNYELAERLNRTVNIVNLQGKNA